MDDGAGVDKTLAAARTSSTNGFVAHPDKCCWEPTQDGELLGFSLNLKEGIIRVPQQRIKGLKERIVIVTRQECTATARQLAILVGTVVSMGLALGPVSRLWTRAMYRDILSADFWSQRITLSPEALREVQFWEDSFEDCHGQPIWKTNPR